MLKKLGFVFTGEYSGSLSGKRHHIYGLNEVRITSISPRRREQKGSEHESASSHHRIARQHIDRSLFLGTTYALAGMPKGRMHEALRRTGAGRASRTQTSPMTRTSARLKDEPMN